MYAILRSARIAPKKANLMAKMVRGRTVPDAIELLSKTHKKSARLVESVLLSAMANAEHNLKQDAQMMVVKEDRKSTRLNSSHVSESRMPSSA